MTHSIRNFILKKWYKMAFLIKWTWDITYLPNFYDFVTSYMNKMRYDVISQVHFIKNYPVIWFFSIKISYRISYFRILSDNFKNVRKIKFQWGRIFEKPVTFCEFSLSFFNLKTILSSQKIGELKLGGSQAPFGLEVYSLLKWFHLINIRPRELFLNNCVNF